MTEEQTTEEQTIKIVIGGAGKMAKMTLNALAKKEDIEVVGVVNRSQSTNLDSVKLLFDVPTSTDLDIIRKWKPDLVIDFSNKIWTQLLLRKTVASQINTLIGTSGVHIPKNIEMRIKDFPHKSKPAIAIIPNFSVGMMLLIQATRMISGGYSHVAIIEQHASTKKDAPSQTALHIAKDLQQTGKNNFKFENPQQYNIKNENPSGANYYNIPIHSIRMPNKTPQHEIILSNEHEQVTLKHESFTRESFIPGLLYSIYAMQGKRNIIIEGLEDLIFSQ